LCASALQALEGADALAIVTAWPEFRSPDFAQMRQRLIEPVIFDGRNLYDPAQMHTLGWRYFAIGRGAASRSARHDGAPAAHREGQAAVAAA
jgi:UDPglucose 6-dehydrogenase